MVMERLDDGKCNYDDFIVPDQKKSFLVQLVLSLAIGVSTFFLFCVRQARIRKFDGIFG